MAPMQALGRLPRKSLPKNASISYGVVLYRIVSYRIASYRIVSYRIVSYEEKVARRRQLGRRDSEEAVSRAMQKHFAHIPTEVVETHRIEGLLVREVIRRDRAQLPQGGRLGTSYWVSLASQISRSLGGLQGLRPASKEHIVT